MATGLLRTVPGALFSVEVEKSANNRFQDLIDKFRRLDGPGLIARHLREAGLDQGLWKVKALRAFHCSAHTPAFAVVRAENHGVTLKVKPGDNGTGTVLHMMVDRGKPWSPEQVFQMLRDREEQVGHAVQAPASVDHVPKVLAQDVIYAIVSAKSVRNDWPDRTEFVRAVLAEIGHNQPFDYYHSVMRRMVADGLLAERPREFVITPAGAALFDPDDPVMEYIRPLAGIAPQAPPAPPPAPPAGGVEPADLLVRHAPDLIGLNQTLEALQLNKLAQDEEQTEINKLRERLAQAEAKLHTLRDEARDLVKRVPLQPFRDILQSLSALQGT